MGNSNDSDRDSGGRVGTGKTWKGNEMASIPDKTTQNDTSQFQSSNFVKDWVALLGKCVQDIAINRAVDILDRWSPNLEQSAPGCKCDTGNQQDPNDQIDGQIDSWVCGTTGRKLIAY